MRLPAVTFQVGLPGYGITAELGRRIALKRGVNTVVVVIVLEGFKLSLQINSVPE